MARAARFYEHSPLSYEQMMSRNDFTLYVDAAGTVLTDTHGQPVTSAHAARLQRILCSALFKSIAREQVALVEWQALCKRCSRRWTRGRVSSSNAVATRSRRSVLACWHPLYSNCSGLAMPSAAL